MDENKDSKRQLRKAFSSNFENFQKKYGHQPAELCFYVCVCVCARACVCVCFYVFVCVFTCMCIYTFHIFWEASNF